MFCSNHCNFGLQVMETPDLWLPCAQNPLEDYDEVAASVEARQASRKRKSQKKRKASSSYIITKIPRKGRHKIKIEIIDLNPQIGSSTPLENVAVSAQYIVCDVVDEIMDMSENLIKKICKKVCDDSSGV